jgi:flavodoxin
MGVLIIYDSSFANTRRIAEAIASGFMHTPGVRVKHVSNVDIKMLRETETLIAGSPTEGIRPTKLMTDFLNSIPPKGLQSIAFAAFDTRFRTRSLRTALYRMILNERGYASRQIDRVLQKKGGIQVLPPEGFYVRRKSGPLKQQELDRAVKWGREIEILVP